MKKVLLLGRRDFGEKNNVADMAAHLRQAGYDVNYQSAYYDELVVHIATSGSRVLLHKDDTVTDIAEFALVVFINWTSTRVLSDLAATTAQYVAACGHECWGSELLSARATTKLSQLYRAAMKGVRVAESVFSLDPQLLLAAAADLPGEAIIAKDIEASRGRRNLKSPKSALDQALAAYKDYPMIVQAYIPNDGSDLRFVMFGGEVGLIIRRSSDGNSHLTNISAGGHGEIIAPATLPAELLREATKLSEVFGREICGIDYMYDTALKQYIFLEINTTPQLTNGAFVREKMVRLSEAINDRLGKR